MTTGSHRIAPSGTRATRKRHVLVTGLPNFVALQLVWRIIDNEPDTDVSLLVRGDLVDRTEQALARRVGTRARIRIFVGDVVALDLGLSGDEYRHLAASVTDIYHMASIYHLGVDKRHAEEVNIGGTRNMLATAREFAALRRFNHYSTAFVSGDREGVILESELDRGQHFRNTFERTKFTAELEVRRAMKDLPISAFRPSLVVGDSRTGEIDRLDGPYFLIQLITNNPTRLPIPLPSSGNFPLNVVPADYVASALHAISLEDDAEGHTFHLVDPNPVAAKDAFRLIAQHAQRSAPRGFVPTWMSRQLLALPGVEKFTRSHRAFLHEFDSLTLFNSMNALNLLRRSGVHCPPFPTYAKKLVQYIQRRERGWGNDPAVGALG